MVVELALALVLVMRGLLALVALVLVLVLLPPLALPALVLAGTRARRLEQLKTRRTRQRDEASGLVRGWRRQQLPRLQGLWRRRRRDHDGRCVGSRRVVQRQLRRRDLRQGVA